MNWKYFFLGVGAGIASAFIVKETAARRGTVSPEQVLEQVKATFKKEGSISGSWINMTAEPFLRAPIEHQVYKGGITRTIDGRPELYEFIADAKTGTIIETNPIS